MELELKAEAREKTGNKLKTLRKKGFIPAVVYGPGHKPISVQVNYEEFRKIFEQAGESTIIKLKVKSQKSKVEEKNVLIHDFARDPISDKFIHIDFYHVRMDKPITAEVPLVFEGEAPAVKNLEGVLVKNITEIEVEALPKDLPHEIKVDISSLDSFDKHIKIKDLKLPAGVKVLVEPEEIITTVIPPRAEEVEEKPVEKVEEVAGAEGKVEEVKETEEKPKEETRKNV